MAKAVRKTAKTRVAKRKAHAMAIAGTWATFMEEHLQECVKRPPSKDWQTLNEIIKELKMSKYIVKARLEELVKIGKVEKDKFVVTTESGRNCNCVHYKRN